MAIDTENKRRSVSGTYPVPDGYISSGDRTQIAGFYRGLAGTTYDLTATIAAVTTVSTIDLLIGTLRELATTIAAVTTTSTATFDAGRYLTAQIDATTQLSDCTVVLDHALTTQIAAAAATSNAAMAVLREVTASIDATTTLSDINMIVSSATTLLDTTIQSITPKRSIQST